MLLSSPVPDKRLWALRIRTSTRGSVSLICLQFIAQLRLVENERFAVGALRLFLPWLFEALAAAGGGVDDAGRRLVLLVWLVC